MCHHTSRIRMTNRNSYAKPCHSRRTTEIPVSTAKHVHTTCPDTNFDTPEPGPYGHRQTTTSNFHTIFRFHFPYVHGENGLICARSGTGRRRKEPLTGLQIPCLRVILGVFKKTRVRWCTYQQWTRDGSREGFRFHHTGRSSQHFACNAGQTDEWQHG